MFTEEPPSQGVYLDCRDKSVRIAPSGYALLPVVTEWDGRQAPFRYFSTALGRRAGAEECWIGSVPSRLGILAAERQSKAIAKAGFAGTGHQLGEVGMIDLARFIFQTRMMFLLSPEAMAFGGLYVGGSDYSQTAAVLPEGAAHRGWDLLRKGVLNFSVATEGAVGAHGRGESRVLSPHGALFYLDKASGALCGRGGEIISLGLGSGRGSGNFSHLNWHLVPQLNKKIDAAGELREIGREVGARKNNITLRGGLQEEEIKSAILELLAYHCHRLGPTGGTVLRAKGSLIRENWGAWITSSGSRLTRTDPEEWGKCKQAELSKILATFRGAGIEGDTVGLGKLQAEVTGRSPRRRGKPANSAEGQFPKQPRRGL